MSNFTMLTELTNKAEKKDGKKPGFYSFDRKVRNEEKKIEE